MIKATRLGLLLLLLAGCRRHKITGDAITLGTIASAKPGLASIVEPPPPVEVASVTEPLPPPAPPAPKKIVPRSECKEGERRLCSTQISKYGGLMMPCVRMPNGAWRFSEASCDTPLVLSFDGAPVTYTDAPGHFSIGAAERTEWVSAATPFLILDRGGPGCVDGERDLFGADAEAANGFDKLARYDDDRNGRIDANDASYRGLALWYDRNQNRACTRDEIRSLADAGVIAIDLAYARPPAETFGSHEGERARVLFRDAGGAMRFATMIDVYLAPL